jgi:hypothetical protein
LSTISAPGQIQQQANEHDEIMRAGRRKARKQGEMSLGSAIDRLLYFEYSLAIIGHESDIVDLARIRILLRRIKREAS